MTMKLRLDNLLDFPFGFTIDNVRHGLFVVGAMRIGLVVLGEEVDVKDWMDLHGWG